MATTQEYSIGSVGRIILEICTIARERNDNKILMNRNAIEQNLARYRTYFHNC